MKKIRSAVVAMMVVGSVGWAEDEDSDTVVNAISGGSGVNYKVEAFHRTSSIDCSSLQGLESVRWEVL